MLFKICVAALSIAAVVAEPPVNNGYLPPPTSAPGYNYPTPQQPLSPSPPQYRPPPPPPQTPTYRPPVQNSPPSYGPPPPPAPPRPSYGPPVPPPQPPRPTYGTPLPPSPPPKPFPSYGPPVTGSDTSYRPVQGLPPTSGNGVSGPLQDPIPGPAPGGHDHGHDHGDHHHHEPGMPFDFNYAVKDDYYGTDYSHNAVSDGDVVRGEYKVLLPDGRLQIVTYTADWKNGYNAEIKYQGEPQYPAQGQNQAGPGAGPSGQYQAPGQAGGSGPY